MNSKKRLIGIFLLLTTAIIWGGSFISQLAGATIGSHVFNAARSIFSTLTCLVVVFINNLIVEHRFTFFKRTDNVEKIIMASLICGGTLFFGLFTQQIGVERTDTAKAGLIAALEAICVPIILFVFYKRKIKLITWIFIVTSMIGVMLLSINSVTGINEGDLWVFISTIIYSITIIQLDRYAKDIDPFIFSFFRMLVVTILCVICVIVFELDTFSFEATKAAMPSILYCGVLSSGVAYILQILGQKNCEPIIATLIMCLEGVFAALFGWLLLNQSLNFIQLIGVFISFVSIIIVQVTDNQG